MEYHFKKFNQSTLQAFLQSDEYLKSDIWPISFHKATSLINNPRLEPTDVMLILAEFENNIVGYRSMLSDWIFNGEKKIKVGWICGSWVDPEHRRRGLSEQILEEVNRAWHGRIVLSTTSSNSKKSKDKTGLLEEFGHQLGCRFQMKSNLNESLPSKYPLLKKMGKVLPAADYLFNDYVLPFITDINMKSRLSYSILIKSKLNEEECKLLFKHTFSQRTSKELSWILEQPWILELAEMDEKVMHKYSFTAGADVFKHYFCVVYKSGVLVAIVMITIKNQQMKVPYFYSADLDYAMIADLLFNEAWKNALSHIDVFDKKLVEEMKLKSAYFAFSKQRQRSYLVSKDIISEFPNFNAVKVSDGEGDMIFS